VKVNARTDVSCRKKGLHDMPTPRLPLVRHAPNP
jgi:hypothetical protein